MTPREVVDVGSDDETDVLEAHPVDALMKRRDQLDELERRRLGEQQPAIEPDLSVASASSGLGVRSVATPLPPGPHGKERVDGSSPAEGSAKYLEVAAFSCRSTRLRNRPLRSYAPQPVPASRDVGVWKGWVSSAKACFGARRAVGSDRPPFTARSFAGRFAEPTWHLR
jgi:hypothetical protein